MFAGEGMAWRRNESLLCAVSISHQQDADSHENSLHEG